MNTPRLVFKKSIGREDFSAGTTRTRVLRLALRRRRFGFGFDFVFDFDFFFFEAAADFGRRFTDARRFGFVERFFEELRFSTWTHMNTERDIPEVTLLRVLRSLFHMFQFTSDEKKQT